MTRIQLRRGTAEQWRDVDPVLSAGEPGHESDTGRHKIGDGTRTWKALPYFVDEDVLLQRSSVVNEAALGRWWAMCARSETDSVRAVFLGSSTSAGTGASTPERRWVNRWMRHLQQSCAPGSEASDIRSLSSGTDSPPSTPGLHGFNGANGGSTSATYCSTIHHYAIAVLDPVLVVHMIGSNDSVPGAYFVPVNDYRRNIESTIDAMGSGSCHLLVHTFRRFSQVSVKEWDAYGNALREIASTRRNVAFVDLSGEFEEAHRDGDPARLISSDTVHPTDAGHALLADATSRRLGLGPVGTPTSDTARSALRDDTGWRAMALPEDFTLAEEAGSHLLRRVGDRVTVRFRLQAAAGLAGRAMSDRLDLMELPDGFAAPGRECVATAYAHQPLRPAAVGSLSSRSTVSLEVLAGASVGTWQHGDVVTGQVEWVTNSDWPEEWPGDPA